MRYTYSSHVSRWVKRFRGTVEGVRALATLLILSFYAVPAAAQERRVGPAEAYTTIGDALGDAVDGDVVIVTAGTYAESLETRADGVTIRAEGEAIVTASGRVLRVSHDRVTIDGLIFDGEYGDGDALQIRGSEFVLRNAEVRRAARDCIDIGGVVSDVTIEDSEIHHCLRSSAPDCAADSCRDDAHGIVADQVQGLDVRRTRIHTFSGDAIQLNGRDQPTMWQDVVIEGCVFSLAPLASAEGGFAAGVVPGENAIDTKTPDDIVEPARMTIHDTVATGYRNGLISNMAAYNLKENVRVTLDRLTIADSEIAFRLRGATSSRPRGAQVIAQNAVIYDVDTAVRYEDDLMRVALRHVTLGRNVGRPFQRAGAMTGAVGATNVLVLGDSLPDELMSGTNALASAGDFVDAAADDYHLVASAAAVDAGEALIGLILDRDAITRPQGAASDIGAYEHCDGCVPEDAGAPSLDAGPPAGTDAGPLPPGVDGGPGMDAGPPDGVDDGGCSCRAARGRGAPWGLLALLALLALRRR